jgi:alanyl-tRNA synthetase
VALVDASLSKQIKAGDLIKELAPLVGAKGGGKPEFAQAGGGTDPSQFTQVAQKLPSLLPNGVAV